MGDISRSPCVSPASLLGVFTTFLSVLHESLLPFQHVHRKPGLEPGQQSFDILCSTVNVYRFRTDVTPPVLPIEHTCEIGMSGFEPPTTRQFMCTPVLPLNYTPRSVPAHKGQTRGYREMGSAQTFHNCAAIRDDFRIREANPLRVRVYHRFTVI